MTDLGKCIRLIRKKLGDSQEQFGRRIGVDQTTVSQYENGRVVPSEGVIARIYASAHGDQQQQKHLRGIFGKHVAGDMMAAEAFFDRQEVLQFLLGMIPRKATLGRNVNARFAELVADLIADDELDDSINEVLGLWLLNGTPRTAWVFKRAAAYIESELNMLAILGDRHPEAKSAAASALAVRSEVLSPAPPAPAQRGEKDAIISALAASDGDRSKAARLLGIPRGALDRKLAEFKI